jgi:hypothetical protein
MASTMKLTKLDIKRDQQDSATPHKATAYYVDPTIPGAPTLAYSVFVNDGQLADSATFQGDFDSVMDADLGYSIDWTL